MSERPNDGESNDAESTGVDSNGVDPARPADGAEIDALETPNSGEVGDSGEGLANERAVEDVTSVPSAPIRPMSPSERRAARAGLSHGQIPVDPSLRITDRASSIFVLLTVGVFVAILINALVFGRGGLLTKSPTPSPVPSLTAAPSSSPLPSASAGTTISPVPSMGSTPSVSPAAS